MEEEHPGKQRVQWPERRKDVLEALRALGDRAYQDQHWRFGKGWPDLTAAVHWLIDDTFIDQHGARALIPHLFLDQREADLVQTVVDALLRVLDDLGPAAPDNAYLDHPGWINVLYSAEAAHTALSSD
ncbi:SCO4402 family protein [Nonomuraea sp. H19]|uniref:SCO4402 family protein n=1 Tax=Nonomuraea sp. H19 TaxID=3452206 RepID=UPI003F8BC272